MAETSLRTVAVLGLGVMGGSLVRALHANAPNTTVVGWSPAVGERDAALDLGVLAAAPSAWEEAVEEASLVVLAMPLGACLTMLPALDVVAPERATLMDVASLKVPVARAVTELGLAHRWVGAHPMAGSEGTGFARSRDDLFEEARVWLVAGPEAAGRVGAVHDLWRGLGGHPLEIGAEEHDRTMALVSHLPQLVSNALGAEMARRGVVLDVLGPGGRDMTRLAASSPDMWGDLLRHAAPELVQALRGVAATAAEVASALESGDTEAVERLMRETAAWREES
ncbi:MAG: prephenate dehydrogenase/arogenate dehydrogenase family protein [Gemmatimonadota bacterium]